MVPLSLVKATPISRQRSPVSVAMTVLTRNLGAFPSWSYPPFAVCGAAAERVAIVATPQS
jgi:hypothetical protein